jgi:hypothetical protein
VTVNHRWCLADGHAAGTVSRVSTHGIRAVDRPL